MPALEKPQLAYDHRWSEPSLAESYQHYLDVHQSETADRPELLDAKARIARAALTLYDGAQTIDSFNQQVEQQLAPHLGTSQLTLISKGGVILPMEAIDTTRKNVAIAARYGQVANGFSQGMLLSGSSAWGSFYATRGNRDKPSDVDLSAQVESIDAMEALIEAYVAKRMVAAGELGRIATFRRLHAQGKADMYSLRTFRKGTEVSMHIMLSKTMEQVRDFSGPRMAPMTNGQLIPTVMDFRPNTSSNAKLTDGYEIFLVDRPEKATFIPENRRVECPETGKQLGYIAESPIGGVVQAANGDETYGMGLLSFFAGVSPVIVTDPSSKLQRTLKHFQLNVAGLTPNPACNVPRLDRMPNHTSQQVLNDLSLSLRHAA